MEEKDMCNFDKVTLTFEGTEKELESIFYNIAKIIGKHNACNFKASVDSEKFRKIIDDYLLV